MSMRRAIGKLRLVVQLELPRIQRRAQALLERETLGHFGVDFAAMAQETLARLTRLVKRGFRILQQRLGVAAVLGKARQPRFDVDPDLVIRQ